jgi:Arylsulfotransferase (ASST)
MGLRSARRNHLVRRIGAVTAVVLVLLAISRVASWDQAGKVQGVGATSQPAPTKVGVSINDSRAFQGYTLFAPMSSTTYLIDMQGKVVRTWESDTVPGYSAYLLENGDLLRPGVLPQQSFGSGPGAAGRVQRFTWDGEIIWDYTFATEKQLPHHDVAGLPNGNVLIIAWEKKTAAEAIAAGRNPESLNNDWPLLPDCLIEINPTGTTTGQIVWEWHLWDHLIQDHDSAKANYGDVAAHPELVDLNYREGLIRLMLVTREGQDKLRSIGYLAVSPYSRTIPPRINPDWTHINSVDYNAELDQIALSVHGFSEVWIIDHSTTTAEAASHRGGRSGKGGDLLYRWGNPWTYRAGTVADQKLFAQHDARWIPKGLPGEGHLLVFNNGWHRPGGDSSSVDEVLLPVDEEGRYFKKGAAFGPDQPVWSYAAPKKSDFNCTFMSGAQRLPNGNTLICSGPDGTIFEVTPKNEIVWKYANPVQGGPGLGAPDAPGGLGGPPPLGLILPPFLQHDLHLSPEQKKQLDEFQQEVQAQLDRILTDEQRKRLPARSGHSRGGIGGLPAPGQILSASARVLLKLNRAQDQQWDQLQEAVDRKLDTMMTGDQRKRFQKIREEFARAGPSGGPRPSPRPAPTPGGPGGSPGGPAFVPSKRSLFRAARYAPDYPGLAGKELKPGKTVEATQPKEPEKKAPR